MIHKMKLRPEPFSVVKSGRKKYELRLLDEKRKQIRPGDEIVFTETESGEELPVSVLGIHVFSSFEELYRSLPLCEIGYTEENVASASYKDMESFYPKEEQESYGVVAIEICKKQKG